MISNPIKKEEFVSLKQQQIKFHEYFMDCCETVLHSQQNNTGKAE